MKGGICGPILASGFWSGHEDYEGGGAILGEGTKEREKMVKLVGSLFLECCLWEVLKARPAESTEQLCLRGEWDQNGRSRSY